MDETKKENTDLIVDDLKPDAECDFKWKVTPESKIWRFLLCGNVTSIVKHSTANTGVESKEIMDLLFQVIDDGKGIELVNTVQKIFSEGLAANPAAVVYALTICTCSDKLDVKSKAYSILNEVCDASAQFLQFINFHESICKMKRKTTGWSRGHRKAVKKWYCRSSALETAQIITKCTKQAHWAHKDVMKLSHLKPPSEGHKVLTSYISNGLKRTIEKFETETSKNEDTKEVNEVLQYLEKIKLVKSGKEIDEIVPVVKELKLPWDYIPCHLYKSKKLWNGLLSYLPLDVLVTNVCVLAKLERLKGDGKTAFIEKCKDPEAVKASKMHPYSLLLYRETYNNTIKDASRKISWKIDQDIVDALSEAFELSIQNLTPTGKRYFITIDASSSMKAHIINNNFVQCRVAAACMALCIARTEKKAIVKAFSKELAEIKIDKNTKLEEIVKCLDETPLGGTDCSRPIILAKTKKIKTDVFIVFTDKETWSGKTTPSEALCQYRKVVKIPAKLIVIALNVEGTLAKVVADPNDRGMLDIFGFSPSIPGIMHNFAKYDY